MEKQKINRIYVFGITLVAAMGGLLFGCDWVVIGGAKPFYERFFDITSSPYLQGWAISSALVGCLIGAMLSGYLTDRFGRKRPLMISAVIFAIAAIGTGAANQFTPFIVFEEKVGKGKLLVSGIDLQSDLANRPEAQQLLYSLKKYMAGNQFNPGVEVAVDKIRQLVISNH